MKVVLAIKQNRHWNIRPDEYRLIETGVKNEVDLLGDIQLRKRVLRLIAKHRQFVICPEQN